MLRSLGNDWFSFADGKRWRCIGPTYLCEVETAGNVPSVIAAPGIADRIRRIRKVYAGRLAFGALDAQGTAIDILIANAMAESYGTVPSPLNMDELEHRLDSRPSVPIDIRLDELLRDIEGDAQTHWLVRREPGYSGPFATPAKVSVGAHHMLLSTATSLRSQRHGPQSTSQRILHQSLALASKSLHSAQLAVEYLNGRLSLHGGHVPLIAATYNAGSPHYSAQDGWRLRQYGQHIDRWVSYYNASRMSLDASAPCSERRNRPASPPQILGSPLNTTSAADIDQKLSAHFAIADLTVSEIAQRKHIRNEPPPDALANLRELAGLLEGVQQLLGNRPIKINSAYRCQELNRAVGSKDTSMHVRGLAADFVCPEFGPPLSICRAIASSNLEFDQVIHEFGRWVHIGLAAPGRARRRQQLTIDRAGTHVGLMSIAS